MRTIAFVPAAPDERAVLLSVARALDLRVVIGSDPHAALVMAWDPRARRAPFCASSGVRVVNADCVDVSKTFVARVFERNAGSALLVDPLRHVGAMVAKSDENGTHDGEVLFGPLYGCSRTKVYQRLVDNRCGDDQVEDLRVAVCGSSLPLVYRKRRPVATRFDNRNAEVHLESEAFLRSHEAELVRAVAADLGMDYGEVDLLRDRRDGTAWIVDANPTPWGPPNGLAVPERARAITLLAQAFERVFLSRHDRSSSA